MGNRRTGTESFHSERDQITAALAVVPDGDRPDILPSELDVSGGLALALRPSLLAAVEGVESGRYVGIIVAYHSRLGREVEEEEAVWRRVEAAGGRIVMALDGLDTATVDGRMVRRIRSSINAAERERHVEKFELLRQWATAAGIWQRRQVPAGYVKDPVTRRLIPGLQAGLVARSFERRAAGVSVSELARGLGMTTSGVRYLLANRVYLGELRVGQHVNMTAHPALVGDDVWHAAQGSGVRPARRAGAGAALLAGLVRCASCGHVMSRGTANRTESYGCHANHSGGRCPGPASIVCHRLDTHVEQVALPVLAGMMARASLGSDTLTTARGVLTDAKGELRAYLLATSAAGGGDVFAEGVRVRQQAVAVAEEAVRVEMSRRPMAPLSGPVERVWLELSAGERNTVLRGLIEAVVVWPAGRGGAPVVADRVCVIRFGAGLMSRRASGIVTLGRGDVDDELVLGVPGFEDGFEGSGG